MFHMKSPSLVLGEWSGDVMFDSGVKSASSPLSTGELRLYSDVRLVRGRARETFSADRWIMHCLW